MKFLDGLDDDLKSNLVSEFRALWTHMSTAIEGNTLTLGETAFVLSEGLTVKGKPLKDHKDVEGHARAVDLAFALLEKETLTEKDVFDLHALVMTERVTEVYKPGGAWRNDFSSTRTIKNGRLEILEYPHFAEIPRLMERWIEFFNSKYTMDASWEDVKETYIDLHVSFVSIQPFYDGNGRVARIVANLPVLKAGYPPIVIEATRREDYINALQHYTNTNGVPSPTTELIVHGPSLKPFAAVVEESLAASRALVDQVWALQRRREETSTAQEREDR